MGSFAVLAFGEGNHSRVARPYHRAMLGKIEHVALAVADIDAAIAHYKDVWGLEVEHRERVEDQGVEEAMLPLGESYLQLLGAT